MCFIFPVGEFEENALKNKSSMDELSEKYPNLEYLTEHHPSEFNSSDFYYCRIEKELIHVPDELFDRPRFFKVIYKKNNFTNENFSVYWWGSISSTRFEMKSLDDLDKFDLKETNYNFMAFFYQDKKDKYQVIYKQTEEIKEIVDQHFSNDNNFYLEPLRKYVIM